MKLQLIHFFLLILIVSCTSKNQDKKAELSNKKDSLNIEDRLMYAETQKIDWEKLNYKKEGKLFLNSKWVKRDTSIEKYPCNLEETFFYFFTFFPKELTENIIESKEEFLPSHWKSLGKSIRNNLGLWSFTTCLNDFFIEKGVFHPDDISLILLISYHRYLNKQEINIEEQAEPFIEFWKKNDINSKNYMEEEKMMSAIPSIWDFQGGF